MKELNLRAEEIRIDLQACLGWRERVAQIHPDSHGSRGSFRSTRKSPSTLSAASPPNTSR